jgi:hypothetical protein
VINDQWKLPRLLFKIKGANNVSFGGFTGDENGRSAILALKSGEMPLLP